MCSIFVIDSSSEVEDSSEEDNSSEGDYSVENGCTAFQAEQKACQKSGKKSFPLRLSSKPSSESQQASPKSNRTEHTPAQSSTGQSQLSSKSKRTIQLTKQSKSSRLQESLKSIHISQPNGSQQADSNSSQPSKSSRSPLQSKSPLNQGTSPQTKLQSLELSQQPNESLQKSQSQVVSLGKSVALRKQPLSDITQQDPSNKSVSLGMLWHFHSIHNTALAFFKVSHCWECIFSMKVCTGLKHLLHVT